MEICCGQEMLIRQFIQKTVHYCSLCNRYETRPTVCEHDYIPIEFITSSGVTQIRQYCKKCHVKTSKSEPKSNYVGQELRRATFENYDNFIKNYYGRDDEDYKTFIKSITGDTGTLFQLKYANYINSAEWKSLRNKILIRDGERCRICGKQANEVHHLTYSHFEREYEFELVSLCFTCHTNEYHNERKK